MKLSNYALAVRAVYLVVLPVAILGVVAWGMHARVNPEPKRVIPDELIYTRGVVVVDNEGRERIVLRAKDDIAAIDMKTPDGRGRVAITASRSTVKVAAAEGSQVLEITPSGGVEKYSTTTKGPESQ